MTTEVQIEYRNLPLANLNESANNPRRTFDPAALNELAESIRTQGLLSPLLVRPKGAQSYEIVAGARRYRAAQLAGLESVPVRIAELTDAQAIEASIVENLIRADVHPMEEASGFRALLNMEEPKYSIEQIAARTGKTPVFIAARLKLTELVPAVVEAFYRDEIGTGHALLLAKLQPAQQEEALKACYQEQFTSNNKSKRILLPVRQLQSWIEHNILLELASAPFSKDDAQLLPEAGACLDCPKRTGHNTLLFEGMATQNDSCSDPKCYAAKLDKFIQQTISTKPKLVQISTAYGTQKEGSATVPRNKYVEVRSEKPTNPKQRDWPEYKTCKFTTEAIVTEGSEKGEMRRICANAECPIHHARKPKAAPDANAKAEQEKRRREEAIAQATGLRILNAIVEAVPVRLMKRDLLFIVERLTATVEERRLAVLLRLHGINKTQATTADAQAKLFTAFLRKSDESTLGRVLVELSILQTLHSQSDSSKALREAAEFYKVDVAAITAKVKQEFSAKDKAKAAKPAKAKPPAKAAKNTRAA
jgi:ParB family chromosome partitioning protein